MAGRFLIKRDGNSLSKYHRKEKFGRESLMFFLSSCSPLFKIFLALFFHLSTRDEILKLGKFLGKKQTCAESSKSRERECLCHSPHSEITSSSHTSPISDALGFFIPHLMNYS
eukprot:Sdes_comp22076_c0_seq1m20602